MSREPNKVRLAQVMYALRGNPLTIKEIARVVGLRYKMTWKYLKELETQNKTCLTDMFANTEVNQARSLCFILNHIYKDAYKDEYGWTWID